MILKFKFSIAPLCCIETAYRS